MIGLNNEDKQINTCMTHKKKLIPLILTLLFFCAGSLHAGEMKEGERLFYDESYSKSFDIVKDPFGLHYVGGEIQEAAKLGASWIRPAIFWFKIEPQKGNYRIDRLARGLNAATSRGLLVAPRIISVNPWANSAKINRLNRIAKKKGRPIGNYTFIGYPTDIEAYKKFLTKLVETFDGDGKDDAPGLEKPVKYWQIENEWDWRWKDTPDNFVKFQRIAYSTIKEADPEAKVILGGIGGLVRQAFVDGYLGQSIVKGGKTFKPDDLKRKKKFMNHYDFIKHVLQSGNEYDVIDFHHFGRYKYLGKAVDWLRDVMKENGYEKPIWIMEGGGPFEKKGEKYTEQRHAQEIIKYYVTAIGNGVEVFFWSSYLPMIRYQKANSSFVDISIVDKRKRKKPAYYSYKLMTSKIKGAMKVSKVRTSSFTYIYKFIKDDKAVYVAWSEKKTKAAVNILGRELTITNIRGEEEVIVLNKPVEITLSESPLFLELK